MLTDAAHVPAYLCCIPGGARQREDPGPRGDTVGEAAA